MAFFASQGSLISRKAQRPRPPWLLTAGARKVRAVLTRDKRIRRGMAKRFRPLVSRLVSCQLRAASYASFQTFVSAKERINLAIDVDAS
jgi:hypothetical protein